MGRTQELEDIARQARRHIVDMVFTAKSGHLGGSLSIADILVALFFEVMSVDPERPDWPDRDRLILSKGHAAPALYAVLALRGYFPVEELRTLRRFGSRLQGHPDMRKTPGVDFTSGSLGNGLGIGNGLALAGRIAGRTYHTCVILGDGELQEGTVWESALTAAAHRLDNLTVIVDYNRLQVEGRVPDIKPLDPLPDKWTSFGWEAVEVDGHDMAALVGALPRTRGSSSGRPTAIIAHTVKGKGVSFMEDGVEWHKGDLTEEQYHQALEELGDIEGIAQEVAGCVKGVAPHGR